MEETAAKEAPGKPIEIWFQDEARIGQKNKVTRRWAKRGTRPSAPHDQRTSSAYIFGAICPPKEKAPGSYCHLLQQQLHGPASRRNLACGRTQRACARSSRSGRVACLGEASRPGQHHALAVAAEIAQAQSGREHHSGSCATTGSRTASSNPTTTFSTAAASPGTSASTSPGKSSPSEQESGPIGRDQRGLGITSTAAPHEDDSIHASGRWQTAANALPNLRRCWSAHVLVKTCFIFRRSLYPFWPNRDIAIVRLGHTLGTTLELVGVEARRFLALP